MLAQPMDKISTSPQAEEALANLEEFKADGAKWCDLKSTLRDVVTPETRALVQQVGQFAALLGFFI